MQKQCREDENRTVKIAYVTSLYPAVSQTFILREIRALRRLGFEILTFSIRRAQPKDILGEEAEAEAARTRSLLPVPFSQFLRAICWHFTRPLTALQTLYAAWGGRDRTLFSRLKSLAYYAEAVLLAYWVSRARVEHLHCHFGNSGSTTAYLAAKLARMPFSLTCHGSELGDIKGNRLPMKVAESTFTACVSQYGRAQLMLHCPSAHWSKLHVVRCGLDDELLERSPDRDGVNRDDELKLMCVARLSPEKGHLVLLDAVAILHRRGIDAQCTLIGDGPHRTTIESHARRLGIAHLVRLTGALAFDRVAEAFRAADVVVLASFSEGVPVVLMEALAVGRPVVATNVGGVGELVIHGETGLLVPPADADALARAIERIASDPAVAAAMAARGREHLKREFSAARSAERLARLFHGALPDLVSNNTGTGRDSNETNEHEEPTTTAHCLTCA